MLFWLKKVVSFWLMPLSLCLVLLLAGWWLLRYDRWRRAGRRMLTLGILLLVLMSNRGISRWLIRPLEAVYSPVPELAANQPLPSSLAGCRYVVVLGGGHGDTTGLSATGKLSASSLGRIVEGVRLAQALPQATLIVSGPADGRGATHASVLSQAAVSLGISASRIRQIDFARDTEEESQAVKALLGAQSAEVALVTSAWHMPRAAGLFRKIGVRIVPCPADFQAKPNYDFRLGDWGWDAESVFRSTMAVREYIGYAWVKMRGKI